MKLFNLSTSNFSIAAKNAFGFYNNEIATLFNKEYNEYSFYSVNFNDFTQTDDPNIDINNESLFEELNDKIGITFGMLALRDPKTTIKKKINQLKKLSGNVWNPEDISFEIKDIGIFYEVNIKNDRILVSLNNLVLRNNSLMKSKENKFIISIRDINKIKVFDGMWHSLTIRTLEYNLFIKKSYIF